MKFKFPPLLKKIIGVILVIIGLFALVTPLTPGAWLGLIGLEMLGFGFIWKDWIKPTFDRLQGKKQQTKSSSQTPGRVPSDSPPVKPGSGTY